MNRYIVMLLTVLFAAPAVLRTQDKPLPPPRDFSPDAKRASDVLPALTLPEYVITGSDIISFTEDRKSELDEPDSQAFTVRAGRGEREQRFMSSTPTRVPLHLGNLLGSDERIRLKLGYGSFETPHAQIWYADRYALGDLALHAQYEATKGHVPRADAKLTTLSASGGSYFPASMTPLFASSRIEGSAHFSASTYGLYADKAQRSDPILDFRRKRNHIAAQTSLISRDNRVMDYDLSIFVARTVAEEHLSVRDTLPLQSYEQREQRIGLDFVSRHSFSGHEFRSRSAFHAGDMKDIADNAVRPFYIRSGVDTRYGSTSSLFFDGGVHMYLYRGNDHPTYFRFYPRLLLRTRLSDNYELFGGYEPEVLERTFDAMLTTNPFLMLSTPLRHTDIPLLIRTGVSYDNRSHSSGRLSIEYLATTSWPRFDLLSDPVRQQWELGYGALTSIFSMRLEMSHHFTSATRVHLSTLLRASHDNELDDRVPYLPGLEVRTLLTHTFPFGLELHTTAQLVGEQRANDADIPAWLLLALEAEYRPWKHVGIFLQLSNLLDHEYQQWTGYSERPFFLMSGVHIRF